MKTEVVEKTKAIDYVDTHNEWKCRVSKTKPYE